MRTIMASFLCLGLLSAGCGDDDGPVNDGDTFSGDSMVGGDNDTGLACDLPARTFWRWDLTAMPPADIQVDATCRGSGSNVAIYVEDDIWGSDMTEADVADVIAAWDGDTDGIYQLTTGLFGTPEDMDDNGRIILLYGELGCFNMTCFDGHFRLTDLGNGTYSNESEMVILDGARPAGDGPADPYMLGVSAHEFQHLLHAYADGNEDSWINEAMSELAMAICGYDDPGWVEDWCDSPGQPLIAEATQVHYGAVFLFGLYLYEQFGADFIQDLVADPANGLAALETHLGSQGVNFAGVMADWATAVLLDDPAIANGVFGYELYDPPTVTTVSGSADGGTDIYSVYAWSARYVDMDLGSSAGGDLAVTFSRPAGSAVIGRVVTSGSATTQVVDLDAASDELDLLIPVPAGHDYATFVFVTADDANRMVSISAELQ